MTNISLYPVVDGRNGTFVITFYEKNTSFNNLCFKITNQLLKQQYVKMCIKGFGNLSGRSSVLQSKCSRTVCNAICAVYPFIMWFNLCSWVANQYKWSKIAVVLHLVLWCIKQQRMPELSITITLFKINAYVVI